MDRRGLMLMTALLGLFMLFFLAPCETWIEEGPLGSALWLLADYTRAHVLLCLVPAFFIAGAMTVYVDKARVLALLGAGSRPGPAYATASIAGAILTVCSCTILPLFSGIVRLGAGLGPATTFLYSGPAISVLAVIFSLQVLGPELAVSRAVAAIAVGIAVGVTMARVYRHEKREAPAVAALAGGDGRPMKEVMVLIVAMILVLIFANWAAPTEEGGVVDMVHRAKWVLAGLAALGVGVLLWRNFAFAGPRLVIVAIVIAAFLPLGRNAVFGAGALVFALLLARGDAQQRSWLRETLVHTRQIVPLLFAGVFAAGLLLGAGGRDGVIPDAFVARLLGGNGIGANLFASVAGAFMYFATLTEIPVIRGLLDAGMGKGPALALLLAGPALSLPNMLVIASVIGWRKTSLYVALVVAVSAGVGLLYGAIT